MPRGSLTSRGRPAFNAALRDLLNGKAGAYRDIVLLQRGRRLPRGRQGRTLREGVGRAGRVIDDGRALKALETLIAVTA